MARAKILLAMMFFVLSLFSCAAKSKVIYSDSGQVLAVETSKVPGVFEALLVLPSAPTPGDEHLKNARAELVQAQARAVEARASGYAIVDTAVAQSLPDANAEKTRALAEVEAATGAGKSFSEYSGGEGVRYEGIGRPTHLYYCRANPRARGC